MTRLRNLSWNLSLVVIIIVVGIITDVVTCDFLDDLHLSTLRARRGPPDCSKCRTELCRMYCGTPGGRKRAISDSQIYDKKVLTRRNSFLDSLFDRLSAERKQNILRAIVENNDRPDTKENAFGPSTNGYFNEN